MDHLTIKGLEIFANHGVFPEEKKLGQKFILNLDLTLDLQKAGRSKKLEDAIHYGILAQKVTEEFQKVTFDLIESCAEHLAGTLLEEYAALKSIQVEVIKPWAPVHLPLEAISVCVNRSRHRVYLGLGSNLGDSVAYLEEAQALLEKAGQRILKVSSTFTTKAWGKEDQPDFKNRALLLETMLTPWNLLALLHEIEAKLDRKRDIHWGPRTIDLDILFYDDEVIYSDDLIIPHAYVQERAFVLDPMAEIAPHFIHPVLRRSMAHLLHKLEHRDGPSQGKT